MKNFKTEEEWREQLGDERFRVMRQKATEMPFTGKYVYNHDDGMYHCAACGAMLFSSQDKFDSGTGWPSFFNMADKENISLKEDVTAGMIRTEVACKKCGSHLGHLFDDGPQPTGLRYCINSCALDFKSKK